MRWKLISSRVSSVDNDDGILKCGGHAGFLLTTMWEGFSRRGLSWIEGLFQGFRARSMGSGNQGKLSQRLDGNDLELPNLD